MLQEPGSYIGEVIKVMGKTKILVKVCAASPDDSGCGLLFRAALLIRRRLLCFLQCHPEGKYVVDLAKDLKMDDIKANLRVALTNDAYTLHKILPSKVCRSSISAATTFVLENADIWNDGLTTLLRRSTR